MTGSNPVTPTIRKSLECPCLCGLKALFYWVFISKYTNDFCGFTSPFCEKVSTSVHGIARKDYPRMSLANFFLESELAIECLYTLFIT